MADRDLKTPANGGRKRKLEAGPSGTFKKPNTSGGKASTGSKRAAKSGRKSNVIKGRKSVLASEHKKRVSSAFNLESLPNNVLLRIFIKAGFKARLSAMQVCKNFHHVASHPRFTRTVKDGKIMETVRHAKAGDTIIIPPGLYEEMVLLEKPLKLVGGLSDRVFGGKRRGAVFQSSRSICVLSNARCAFENLVFRSCIASIDRSICSFGPQCDYMRFDNCEFGGFSGLYVPRHALGHSKLVLVDSLIHGISSPMCGCAMETGVLRMEGCTVTNCHYGVDIHSRALCYVRNSEISFNDSAMMLSGKGVVCDNIFWGNSRKCALEIKIQDMEDANLNNPEEVPSFEQMLKDQNFYSRSNKSVTEKENDFKMGQRKLTELLLPIPVAQREEALNVFSRELSDYAVNMEDQWAVRLLLEEGRAYDDPDGAAVPAQGAGAGAAAGHANEAAGPAPGQPNQAAAQANGAEGLASGQPNQAAAQPTAAALDQAEQAGPSQAAAQQPAPASNEHAEDNAEMPANTAPSLQELLQQFRAETAPLHPAGSVDSLEMDTVTEAARLKERIHLTGNHVRLTAGQKRDRPTEEQAVRRRVRQLAAATYGAHEAGWQDIADSEEEWSDEDNDMDFDDDDDDDDDDEDGFDDVLDFGDVNVNEQIMNGWGFDDQNPGNFPPHPGDVFPGFMANPWEHQEGDDVPEDDEDWSDDDDEEGDEGWWDDEDDGWQSSELGTDHENDDDLSSMEDAMEFPLQEANEAEHDNDVEQH